MFDVQRLKTNFEPRTPNVKRFFIQGGKVMAMIHTFGDIEAWQKARKLSIMVYEYTKYDAFKKITICVIKSGGRLFRLCPILRKDLIAVVTRNLSSFCS